MLHCKFICRRRLKWGDSFNVVYVFTTPSNIQCRWVDMVSHWCSRFFFFFFFCFAFSPLFFSSLLSTAFAICYYVFCFYGLKCALYLHQLWATVDFHSSIVCMYAIRLHWYRTEIFACICAVLVNAKNCEHVRHAKQRIHVKLLLNSLSMVMERHFFGHKLRDKFVTVVLTRA